MCIDAIEMRYSLLLVKAALRSMKILQLNKMARLVEEEGIRSNIMCSLLLFSTPKWYYYILCNIRIYL